MGQESVDPGFSEARELLAEIHEFPYVRVWIDVAALFGCLVAQYIADHCGMPKFLLRHKLYQIAILRGEAGGLELRF